MKPLFAEKPHQLGKMAGKVGRDAFIYLSSTDPHFAECKTCAHLTPDKTCTDLGIKVKDEWTCALYVPGSYDGGKPAKRVSAEDAGLVKVPVRCENCYYGGDKCGLYVKINKALPNDFALEETIEPKACCNAWVEK